MTDPDGVGYTMDVRTEYGALRIEPVLSRMWPWTDKVDKFIRNRMFGFLKHIETASANEAVIPAPMEGTIPNEDDVKYAKSRVNLWNDEAVCSALRSKDLYNVCLNVIVGKPSWLHTDMLVGCRWIVSGTVFSGDLWAVMTLLALGKWFKVAAAVHVHSDWTRCLSSRRIA